MQETALDRTINHGGISSLYASNLGIVHIFHQHLLICDFRKLGNCASKSTYDYTEEEVELIFKELDLQIQLLREKFEGKKRFSLRTAPEDSY